MTALRLWSRDAAGGCVYKVEDTLVAGESLDVIVSNYVKGEEGTPVQITVYRADEDAMWI